MRRLTTKMLLMSTGAIVFIFGAIVGCSPGPSDSGEEQNPAKPAVESSTNDEAGIQRVVIYVQNTDNKLATLYMDGQYVGEVSGNDYVTVPTTIGEHVLSYERGGFSTSRRITVSRAWQTISI